MEAMIFKMLPVLLLLYHYYKLLHLEKAHSDGPMRHSFIWCAYGAWRGPNQRCVVRGIALSSLLSCRLLANLNSRGSSVAPTWAHLCWPGSRSVHGSIHSCVIGRPRFARRGHPKYCLGCLARSRRPPSVNESQRELAASGSIKLPRACQASQFHVGSPIEAL